MPAAAPLPVLLPGTHVLRRSAGHLQAGLHRAAATVVVASGGQSCAPEALLATPAHRAALLRAGLALADERVLRRALPPLAEASSWPRHAVAALARREPLRLADAVDGRAAHEVHVTAFGHPVAADLAADARALLGRAGLSLTGPRRPGPRSRRTLPTPVHLLVGVGEPVRDQVDDLVREAVPHLVVRLVEGYAVVGPLVVPGRTACLRCLDAYQAEEDPAWPLLVEQYARACSRDRSDGIPEPVDPALATVAVGWAVRDLATYLEGEAPPTLSGTVRLAPDLREVEARPWAPHPACGCGWE